MAKLKLDGPGKWNQSKPAPSMLKQTNLKRTPMSVYLFLSLARPAFSNEQFPDLSHRPSVLACLGLSQTATPLCNGAISVSHHLLQRAVSFLVIPLKFTRAQPRCPSPLPRRCPGPSACPCCSPRWHQESHLPGIRLDLQPCHVHIPVLRVSFAFSGVRISSTSAFSNAYEKMLSTLSGLQGLRVAVGPLHGFLSEAHRDLRLLQHGSANLRSGQLVSRAPVCGETRASSLTRTLVFGGQRSRAHTAATGRHVEGGWARSETLKSGEGPSRLLKPGVK